MKNSIASMLIALLFTACAGTPFRWEDTEKVKTGMTENEVIAILGQPLSISQSGNQKMLTWRYAVTGSLPRSVTYRLENGRVAGVTTQNKDASR